jgi:hypothetical protein
VGAAEAVLAGEESEDRFRQIVCSVGELRHAEGPRDHLSMKNASGEMAGVAGC